MGIHARYQIDVLSPLALVAFRRPVTTSPLAPSIHAVRNLVRASSRAFPRKVRPATPTTPFAPSGMPASLGNALQVRKRSVMTAIPAPPTPARRRSGVKMHLSKMVHFAAKNSTALQASVAVMAQRD